VALRLWASQHWAWLHHGFNVAVGPFSCLLGAAWFCALAWFKGCSLELTLMRQRKPLSSSKNTKN